MIVTNEWIEAISDERGLTKGQEYLLDFWCKDHQHIDKDIPDQVANYLLHCRSYREIPQHIKDFKGWV